MKQYMAIRNKLPEDTILFFRLGDFYEMFFDDASAAAEVLDIALTKRNKVPMCGVPYHAADSYLAKLIRAGKKVAVCEQVENPAEASGVVRREIVRIVTPGTILEESFLESKQNNYLAGLCSRNGIYGLALMDLSTGLFWIEEAGDAEAVRNNLFRYSPSECVIPEEQFSNPEIRELLGDGGTTIPTAHEDWTFEYDMASDLLIRHFRVHSLDGFGCDGRSAGVGAAGGVLHYVTQELRRQAGHVTSIRVKNPSDYVFLDEATLGNLDILSTDAGRTGHSNTLLGALDTTLTAMGGRMLRDWLLRPLTDLEKIGMRHDAVEAFCNDRGLLNRTRGLLSEVKDLERLVSRLGAGSGNGRDVNAIARSLSVLPDIHGELEGHPVQTLRRLAGSITPMPELVGRIREAIVDEPPITIRDGGLINAGYHGELDELRETASQGRKWLAEYQAREQQRTGIKNLKVRHNKVFGYYIEITKSNLNDVPLEYSRKQTLVNAERFITPELKDYENRILGAHERSVELEYELFLEIRKAIVDETVRIQSAAFALAELDVLSSMAERALAMRYIRPAMTDGDAINIRDGRHPVIERISGSEPFVSNDTLLDGYDNQLVVITGPNMAGKSTYIRQVALLVLMAQSGSFIPAAGAEIGVVDRVFTRVGASDDLARGRSTFMVEMQETANILANATRRSLIVLDEIGRGTSTFDGISIAWAVAEYIHNHDEVKAKTLFATHYHELTDLARTMSGVKNYNVLVREKNDRIAFLRKIAPGAADKSYGIQVARLAGLPAEVIDRAKEILVNLEEGEFGEEGQPKLARRRSQKPRDARNQLSLFGGSEP